MMPVASIAVARAFHGRPLRIVLQFLQWAAFALLLSTLALSYLRPLIFWDSWSYHLPFSAELAGIGDPHDFVLSPTLAVRRDGFPLLAEWLQGLLWRATGRPGAAALLNSLAWAAFCLASWRFAKASLPILAFGTLAVPLIATHAIGSYVDLYYGCCVAIVFVCALKIVEATREPGGLARGWKWSAWLAASAALAGNAKLISPPVVLAQLGFLGVYAILRVRPRLQGRDILVLSLGIAAASLLCCTTWIRNELAFGNPVYPVAVDIPALGIHLPGPEEEYRDYPGYLDKLGGLAKPAYFVTSVTETDWLIRGVQPLYGMEIGAGDFPQRFHSARTGGWWWLLVLASMMAIAIFAARQRSDGGPSQGRDVDRFMLLQFAVLTLVTSVMPQSHELRYFLYWPLILVLIVARLAMGGARPDRRCAILGVLYVALFLYSTLELRGSGEARKILQGRNPNQVFGVSDDAPQIQAARKAKAGICLGPSYNPNQFKYAAIFHGGSYVIEQGWKECRDLPSYDAARPGEPRP